MNRFVKFVDNEKSNAISRVDAISKISERNVIRQRSAASVTVMLYKHNKYIV